MKPQISLKNINKTYGDHEVLKDVNLDIYPKDFITIFGKSGSGKSTLLNILGTLESYDSGSIESFGYSDPYKNVSKAMMIRRENIAYLFQNFALVDNMTVKENIDIALKYSEFKNIEIYACYRNIFFGTSRRRDFLHTYGSSAASTNRIW